MHAAYEYISSNLQPVFLKLWNKDRRKRYFNGDIVVELEGSDAEDLGFAKIFSILGYNFPLRRIIMSYSFKIDVVDNKPILGFLELKVEYIKTQMDYIIFLKWYLIANPERASYVIKRLALLIDRALNDSSLFQRLYGQWVETKIGEIAAIQKL